MEIVIIIIASGRKGPNMKQWKWNSSSSSSLFTNLSFRRGKTPYRWHRQILTLRNIHIMLSFSHILPLRKTPETCTAQQSSRGAPARKEGLVRSKNLVLNLDSHSKKIDRAVDSAVSRTKMPRMVCFSPRANVLFHDLFLRRVRLVWHKPYYESCLFQGGQRPPFRATTAYEALETTSA